MKVVNGGRPMDDDAMGPEEYHGPYYGNQCPAGVRLWAAALTGALAAVAALGALGLF